MGHVANKRVDSFEKIHSDTLLQLFEICDVLLTLKCAASDATRKCLHETNIDDYLKITHTLSRCYWIELIGEYRVFEFFL